MPDRKTIWLEQRSPGDPLRFAGGEDGKVRNFVITGISADKATGYLQLEG